MDTTLESRPAARRWSTRRILACLGVVLFALLAGAGAAAQERPPHGKKVGTEKQAKAGRRPKPAKDAGAAQAAPAPPQAFPEVSTTPRPPPLDKKARAKQQRQAWKRVTKSLFAERLARNPELAFERDWPGISERHLGTFGSGATLRWRKALADALVELHRIRAVDLPWPARAQLGALQDWIEAELLLLESRMPSTSDPAAFVQRAFRTLRAAREARWMSAERRTLELARLVAELPACFRDARIGLVDPVSQWIDLALLDLDDLQELVNTIAAELPRARKGPAGPEQDARTALDGFRAWLLDQRPSAGARPPCLNASEWQRLVRLRSGTGWTVSEIKTRCLRELARLDLAARASRPRSPRADDGEDPARLAAGTSARALQLAREAHLLRSNLTPEVLAFGLETSTRTRSDVARLRPGAGSASKVPAPAESAPDAPSPGATTAGAETPGGAPTMPRHARRSAQASKDSRPGSEGSLQVLLAEPHGSWPAERTITRNAGLQFAAQALGVRHGLAGEALFVLRSRASRSATSVLLDDRLLREGFGLFALDWAGRIDWVENPFRADEELARELQYQLGYEAARLIAALELHAEGLSLEGAASGFQRRTGVDPDTALAEALAAQRDPLHGLGYLGVIELRALEQRLARLARPRSALMHSLQLASRHPDLRPSDLASEAGRAPRPARKKAGISAGTLENPARAQQEQSRSR